MTTTFEPGDPVAGVTGALPRLEPLRYVRANALEVAYFEAGPGDGEAVLLLHGFPFDIHSYVDVIPRLAAAGHRVIVPYLRGHGPTRFTDSAAQDRDSKHPSAPPRTGIQLHPPTTRPRRALLRSRPSQSLRSPWTAWPTATSRPLTAVPRHATSPAPACTTRYPTPDTTFPRSPRTHSPAQSWN